MSEMIERVARALCSADGKDPDALCGIFTCDGEGTVKNWQYHYPFQARRAIEAMREPTDAMMMDFLVEMAKHSDQWRAYKSMIGAALK